MLTATEIVEVTPVIVSLIVIEGLLSVDNALMIAALASHLPKHKQQLALKLGLLGAYFFRGIALYFVSIIIVNPWLKILGAAYLIYLMASNLTEGGEDSAAGGAGTKRHPPGLLATIIQIELMDLTLSLDNVVAAVALDKRLWVVCTGVFVGILALRFLAGLSIKLIEKFPILEKTAFLLIGYVGLILVVEVGSEMGHIEVHINSIQKFIGIVSIVALSLLYERHAFVKTILRPAVTVGKPIMRILDKVFGTLFWPAAKMIAVGKNLWSK